ncbi:MAG: GntR family transcriptional regulator [Oscillospiraceae bacterium]|nr:GntR family transcriptional regulator [Oscillospiraceae bacterium]
MEWLIQDNRPIWAQLQEQLTLRIIAGEYPLGSRLPSVRDLAAEAGVNPNTMQRALSTMEGSGLIVTNRTAGRTVTQDRERLDEIRRGLAKSRIQEYLKGMKILGYSEEEARKLLLEE